MSSSPLKPRLGRLHRRRPTLEDASSIIKTDAEAGDAEAVIALLDEKGNAKDEDEDVDIPSVVVEGLAEEEDGWPDPDTGLASVKAGRVETRSRRRRWIIGSLTVGGLCSFCLYWTPVELCTPISQQSSPSCSCSPLQATTKDRGFHLQEETGATSDCRTCQRIYFNSVEAV
jgi:hypothetical protein